MKKKYNIIAILGEAGSGKDYVLKKALQSFPELNNIINTTTRPCRDNEINHIDYHFISIEDFENLIKQNKILNPTVFNGNWFYGINKDDLKTDSWNICVFNPKGFELISQYQDINCVPIRLKTKDSTRLIRQLNRACEVDIEEVIRRYYTDKCDFNNLHFNLNIFENNNNDDLIKIILFICNIIKEENN